MKLNGVIRITRYENMEPSSEKAKFLALYEIETDGIGESKKAVDPLLAEKRAEGRISERVEVESSVTYKRINFLTK